MARKEDLNPPLKMGVITSLLASLGVVSLLRPFLPGPLVGLMAGLIFVLALVVAVDISVYPD